MISPHVWEAWRPPIRPVATEWIPKHVWMPRGAEYDGLFDFDLAPHTRGVLEAWDDENVREITLVWATRNMKTSTLISLMILAAANYPAPMGYGSCDEMSVDRSIDEQIYPMLDRCEATRIKLPIEAKRGRDSIKLRDCRIRKAFGGSPASVAGWPAKYVFINEADKWPRRVNGEAASLRGFSQRVKGYPFDSKVIKESTPAEMGKSVVWDDLTSETTDQRRFFVQCPKCGNFQVLDFGDADSPHGIKWDKPKSGKISLPQVRDNAYYRCLHKGCRILSSERATLMRSGVWLSSGQSISRKGKITGKRLVESSHIGFGPLGSEYSLLISGWGQIAVEFLACGNDPEKLKDFTNSTRALPWDPKPKKIEPHELAARLCTKTPRGICPDWAVLLTRGVDVQDNANTFPWSVVAWGPRGRAAVIDYGLCYSAAEYCNVHRSSIYPHADGGLPLQVMLTLMDSGDGEYSDDIYRLCRSLPRCLPCKGASSKLEKTFRPSDLHDSEGVPVKLILVHSDRSQGWIEGHIRGTSKNSEPFTLPKECEFDVDYLDQLLSECKVDKTWTKTGVNDQRDAIRYAWAAAMICTDHGAGFDRMQLRTPTRSPTVVDDDDRTPRDTFATATGGRTWKA